MFVCRRPFLKSNYSGIFYVGGVQFALLLPLFSVILYWMMNFIRICNQIFPIKKCLFVNDDSQKVNVCLK